MRRQGKTRWKRGNETGERTEPERTFLHYRHVHGLITGTRGVIFSPSSSRRFAAFFFGLGATSRRLTPLGTRQAVHCHGESGERRAGPRMIECCQSLRRVVRMIHPFPPPRIPHPFDSARVQVGARVRSWREGRGLPYARDRAAGIVGNGLRSPLSLSFHVPPHCLHRRISSIRVLQ